MIEVFDRFDQGFVSQYDVSTEKVPKNALSDCLNIEVNDPIVGIRAMDGYDTELTLPLYSGSSTVAFHKFSVDSPSDKEITILIRKSSNVLKYSEDFEMASVWTFTGSGTGSMVANDISAPIRKADTITGLNNPQLVQVLPVSIPVGVNAVFSLYVKSASGRNVQIVIGDSIDSATFTFPGTGAWLRPEVAYTVRSLSGQFVKIIATGTTGDLSIWGAQIEVGTIATGYGYTTLNSLPYYIYIRSYWDGTNWIDSWLELTEMRAGLLSSVSGADAVLSGMDGADNYFNRWYIKTPTGGNMIFDYTASSQTIVVIGSGVAGYTNGNEVIICRTNIIFKSFFNDTKNNNDIIFTEIANSLRIGFGKVTEAYFIEYKKESYFSNSSKTLFYDEFVLTQRNIFPTEISLVNTPVNDGASGHLVNARSYYISSLGLYDASQKVYIGSSNSILITGGNNAIKVEIIVDPFLFTPRLNRVDVFIQDAGLLPDALSYDTSYFAFSVIISIDPGAITTTIVNGKYKITTDIKDMPSTTTSDSLTGILLRVANLAITSRYKNEIVINGRAFQGNTAESGDYVRLSSIRTIVSEYDVFPFQESSGYGFIIIEAGTAESIIGLARTPTNDLMIFKDRSVSIYEVQSGSVFSRRLTEVFHGVGLSTPRSIVSNTDYGTFWYDETDVYWYEGGTTSPKRTSDGRIRQYWRKILQPYITSSFATFNRKLNEYWIFIQVAGSIGSTVASDYRVLRYAPDRNNWNIAQFPFIPIWVSEKISGELEVVGSDSDIFRWGYGFTSNAMTPSFIKTHKYPVGDVRIPKVLTHIFSEHDVDGAFAIQALIDNESSPRTSNAPSFVSTKDRWKRSVRQSSKFNKIALKVTKGSGNKFNLSSFGIEYLPQEPRDASVK